MSLSLLRDYNEQEKNWTTAEKTNCQKKENRWIMWVNNLKYDTRSRDKINEVCFFLLFPNVYMSYSLCRIAKQYTRKQINEKDILYCY